MKKNEFLCSEESEDDDYDDDDDDEEEDQISKRVTTQMSDIDGDDLNMQANQPLYNPVPGMCKVGLFDMFSSICIALQFIRKMEYDLTHLTQGYNLENLVSFNQSYCLTYLQKLTSQSGSAQRSICSCKRASECLHQNSTFILHNPITNSCVNNATGQRQKHCKTIKTNGVICQRWCMEKHLQRGGDAKDQQRWPQGERITHPA